ncbi:50S ribosomal protein L6 [Blattabacterium cuenoti]|uniref:50S ribosomal protein L6 n=1 Tax=Blattabacterium cuenoti TaxID=1653831 RepID=UPI00163C9581|nr:50S ribosomal protein L6 [Blattabacterium cuenoti]
MSKIGNLPILIPTNVSIEINNNKIDIIGQFGRLSQIISKYIKLEIKNNFLFLKREKEDKKYKSMHGLYRVLINNMIIGVQHKFKKKLELVGIGYRVSKIFDNLLEFHLGYSHNIILEVPKEININIQITKDKNTILILDSINKQLVGQIASQIRLLRKPEPYKGKGIRYLNEYIRKKTGKSA